MDLYLGIDAGGTHTRARLVSGDGTILGTGEAGPANTPAGLEEAFRAVEEAWSQALSEAGLGEADLASIRAGLGIAGLNRRGVLPGLKEHDFPFHSMRFASDAAIAQLGAYAGGDGAIVIVGTGSVGFGRVGDDVFTIGGYGFPVSDEGSGADLGLNALRHALRTLDGRAEPTDFSKDVLAKFSTEPARIIDWMEGASATDYAALAPLVVQHAAAGDTAALQLMRQAGRHIADLVEALFKKGAPQIALIGGLAEIVKDYMPPETRGRLVAPQADAMTGGILLAKRKLNASG
jgi:glucosamine kinase